MEGSGEDEKDRIRLKAEMVDILIPIPIGLLIRLF